MSVEENSIFDVIGTIRWIDFSMSFTIIPLGIGNEVISSYRAIIEFVYRD